MTKKRPDKKQQHFHFHFGADPADETAVDGGTPEELSEFERRLRLTLREVLESCAKRDADPLDRFEVAARLSRKLGREITKSHLDGWTALSAVQRRIHADALKGLCEVTGDWRPLHYFAESCGFKALHPDDAVCADFGAIGLLEKGLSAAKRDLLANVDEKELRDRLIKRINLGGKGE